jgi:hypothetical protein
MSRIGMWSAFLLAVGGVVYAATVTVGMISYGLQRPIGGLILTVMEILTLVLAPLVVAMMAAVHVNAASEFKTSTLVALAFAVLLAGTTTVVHFVELTALRQMGSAGLSWPSPLYAAELLACDVFLGLSLLFAAPAIRGDGLGALLRRTMLVTGAICILGVTGPVTGDLRLQFVAVTGYGLLFPVVCLLLGVCFARPRRDSPTRTIGHGGWA